MIFICRSEFDCKVSELFGFHAGPEGFSSLVGSSKKADIISPPPSLEPGSKAIVRVNIFPGISFHWVALHTELDPEKRFVDIQESGPFAKFKHEHIFIQTGKNSSILEDRITCIPPWYANHFLFEFLLEKTMKNEFHVRHKITAEQIGCNYRNEFCGKVKGSP
ncbi:SRPBCC family protein [Leptospira koniambonensis]|uniref:SRPBCC family protein n=1 Tax=Leptospira koniambonensis TaxID=2484950 RepID=UPI003EBEA13B